MKKTLLSVLGLFLGASMAFAQTNAKYETVLFEDFSKWTEGSEDAPDTKDLGSEENAALAKSLMSTEGEWQLWHAYQAGGCMYFGFQSQGNNPDPGYAWAPIIDFSREDGEKTHYRFSCRAKRAKDGNSSTLQLMVLNNDPDNKGQIAASAQTISYEWQELEWLGETDCKYTTFMFLGWQGGVLVDDVKIEKVVYTLDEPSVISATLIETNKVEVKFIPSEGATSYEVKLRDHDIDRTVLVSATAPGDAESCVLEFAPTFGVEYTIEVQAFSENASSPIASGRYKLAPTKVGDGVALPATNISEKGFTANWEPADFAAKYLLSTTFKHTAENDGEVFPILTEDMSGLADCADEYGQYIVCPMMFGGCSLDYALTRTGWTSDIIIGMQLAPGFAGLALTDMYALYGLKGNLISPAADFSVGGGEVQISGLAMSMVDDMVISAEFIDKRGMTVGETTFEISPTGTMFSAVLSGGKKDCRIRFTIADEAQMGQDAALLFQLNITTTLNKGETIEVPYNKQLLGWDATSAEVSVPFNKGDVATYYVQPYYYAGDQSTAPITGLASDEVVVEYSGTTGLKNLEAKPAVNIFKANGKLFVKNADGKEVRIISANGSEIMSSSDNVVSAELTHGIYFVVIDGESHKVIM